MTREGIINNLIKKEKVDTNLISDGYHTFGELYEQRATLYIALCRVLCETLDRYVWRSTKHSDKTTQEGWFILGINDSKGIQMTYHLPISKWQETEFAKTLDCAPEWDGHTSNDVLERLKKI